MKTHNTTFFPALKPVALKRPVKASPNWLNVARNLLPTFVILALAEALTRYSGSGYSVIVITLLSVMLYTTLRYGTAIGVTSAVLVVLFNFHVVAVNMGSELFSMQTLEGGGVVATVFPVLALIIGRLKSRNDSLLRGAEEARILAEESAQQLLFMAESMPQKIFTNLPNGKSVYMNAQWSEYTGVSKKAIRDWGTVVHPHDMKENMRVWKESLETGAPFQFEHRLRRADGAYVWHLTRAQPLRDKKGKIILWVGSSTDIEDVRRARKLEADAVRLMKQRAELMELNKAKDEFISLASHQLRTPATSVKQYVNMALDGYAGKINPKLREFLEKANTSNERQLSVINDLLQVAQVDAGKVVLRKEPIDIDDMVASIVHDQRTIFADRSQTVNYMRKNKKTLLNADATKLRMVIENIIDNASKYSHENTSITITVARYRGQVRVAVNDEGVGIDKADAEKIFEKFMRLENPLSTVVGGNGLGLYWVRRVVELHGGTITAAPNKQRGTTFTIALPAGSK
ncbi:PAS domain-containing sensor histidine kinase [Candidatus Saccharibacteria bacterium]|nr:PAS domain-containing sensor histidine kinase [Candidatus Saccharibacteria bacterium]